MVLPTRLLWAWSNPCGSAPRGYPAAQEGRYTETHEFVDGFTGKCVLRDSSDPKHSHCIGFKIEGRDKCRLHATFSILDKHDKILRQAFEAGTAAAPRERDFTDGFGGKYFTPTAAEKAQSVRADGSIRLRAEVRLFLD